MKHVAAEFAGFLGVVVIIAAVVLFAGSPDVHDNIVAWSATWGKACE